MGNLEKGLISLGQWAAPSTLPTDLPTEIVDRISGSGGRPASPGGPHWPGRAPAAPVASPWSACLRPGAGCLPRCRDLDIVTRCHDARLVGDMIRQDADIPIANPDDRARYVEGLRKAGLPE